MCRLTCIGKHGNGSLRRNAASQVAEAYLARLKFLGYLGMLGCNAARAERQFVIGDEVASGLSGCAFEIV